MSERVALVIGVGHYENYHPLKYCPPSAEEIYQLLTSPDYGRCNPQRSKKILMRSPTDSLSSSGINDHVQDVISNLQPDDQLLFFFSGHAVVHKDDLFLLLPESQPDQWHTFYDLSGSFVRSLDINSISKAIIIVDACHSEAMFNAIKNLQGDWEPNLPTGVGFMAASSKFEYAHQSPELMRTLFSNYLYKGVMGWADTEKPHITLPELRDYINENVRNVHPEKQQTVHTWIKESESSIWFSQNPAYARKRKMNDFNSPESSKNKPSQQPDRIPFINQQKEIEALLSSYAPAYNILDAPAGYGKTRLLLELKELFHMESWRCAYVLIDENDNLDKIKRTIFRELGEHPPEVENSGQLTFKLCDVLLKQAEQKDPEIKGFMFLIDLGKTPSAHLVAQELTEFISLVARTLMIKDKSDSFSSKQKGFRVIIAGRYLAGREEIKSSKLPLRVLSLGLFSYDIVLAATHSKFPRLGDKVADLISAHVLYLSGGHPGAMAALLKMFEESPDPDYFITYMKQSIQEVVSDEIRRVRNDIPGDLRDTMDILSTCRRFNTKLLRNFMSAGLLPVGDAVSMGDALTEGYLITRRDGFLKDDLTRRLLGMRLAQKEPMRYLENCQAARSFFAGALADPTTDRSDIIAIELLYTELQILSTEGRSETQIGRRKIKKCFFKTLSSCLQTLITERDVHETVANLLDALIKDWEFQFTLNYLLREGFYTQDPYRLLKEKIQEIREDIK